MKSKPIKPPSKPVLPPTRGYQQEMLDESLQRNIVIALDTGSGKTHIAVLRMKHECERVQDKISWFLAPTVSLCRQQRKVVATALPVSVGLISGADEPDQWKNAHLWSTVLSTHKIMVTTPQVLLDALRHGYIDLGRDLSLLIFDEAHHAFDNNPYNQIMKEFYFQIPPSIGSSGPHLPGQRVRPKILGLTASPVYGGNVLAAFQNLEANLDCIIRAPRVFREELEGFVRRPTLKHVFYAPPDYYTRPFSTNLEQLEAAIENLDIEDDPYVKSLRYQLTQLPPGLRRSRIDQRLSETIHKNNSYTHKGLSDFARTAAEICQDVGPWACDWYIQKVLEQLKAASYASRRGHIRDSTRDNETAYLLDILARIFIIPVSYNPTDIIPGITAKVQALIECLEAEKKEVEDNNELYSGLIFVTRRDTVLALAEILSHHPRTAELFSVGVLIGISESARRQTFADITRKFSALSHEDTLEEFRQGDKNLLVSTAVAEEGIDIQACGSVIRWDVPANMVSWAQSRGRARRKRSTYTVMFEEGGVHSAEIQKWEKLEREMTDLYFNDQRSTRHINVIEDHENHVEGDEDLVYRIETTGATLTLQSAIPHLYHFCSLMSGSSSFHCTPIFALDPPDFPEGWHSFEHRVPPPPYPGPWSCTVTLPRQLPPHLQVFTTNEEYTTKISACQHAAFKAYITLYENNLLNNHLLPLTDDLKPEMDEEVKALLKDIEKRQGTRGVSSQMDPWTSSNGSNTWFASELAIDGLPNLLMFTMSPPIPLAKGSGPTLYRSDGESIQVEWRPRTDIVPSKTIIEQAQNYTRRLFWCLNGSRMKWEDLDFVYLFLPTQEDTHQSQWETWRTWLTERNIYSGRIDANNVMANAAAFGTHFSFPTSLTLVNSISKIGRFVRWKFDAASEEEEVYLQKTYSRFSDAVIAPPFLVVQPFPRRRNFLRPLSHYTATAAKVVEPILVLAHLSTFTLLSNLDIEYAQLLPSILRFLSIAITVNSFRSSRFSAHPLNTIPTDLLTTAMTTPVAQELNNYQRLETLGDTVLKFIVGIQLLGEFPHWHEHYLARKKDHAVANVRLAKGAFSKGLHRWIIRDRLILKKWVPGYREANDTNVVLEDVVPEAPPSPSSPSAAQPKGIQELSTKVLADVVESLIGAAYLHGSFDMGIECAQLFNLGITWQNLSPRIESLLSRPEYMDVRNLPKHIPDVERMLDYVFEHKLLLVEALTHASYQQTRYTTSYERMEFLGDSVLDMVVTDILYHASNKNYSPGHIHMRKSAVVNSHFLAYICLRCTLSLDATMPRPAERRHFNPSPDNQTIYLWQCLLHSSPGILEDQNNTFTRYKRMQAEIDAALQSSTVFPWAPLTRLQAPKHFSDVVESVIGAVYLDSHGDFDIVRKLLRRLGILQILERIIKDDVDVLHPVSRLSVWASKNNKKIGYQFEKERGRVECIILVDEKEVVRVEQDHRGRASQEEVKFLASDEAIRKLKLDSRRKKHKPVQHD